MNATDIDLEAEAEAPSRLFEAAAIICLLVYLLRLRGDNYLEGLAP